MYDRRSFQPNLAERLPALALSYDSTTFDRCKLASRSQILGDSCRRCDLPGTVGWASRSLGLATANIAMIFFAGVVLVAARGGRGPTVLAAVLGVLVFDYLFVEPRFRFAPSDVQYVVNFAVMLGTGLLISESTVRNDVQLRVQSAAGAPYGEALRNIAAT